MTQKAKKYGIATDLKVPAEWKDEPLVLQYDVRLSNGLDCGGAYLKFLMPQVRASHNIETNCRRHCSGSR